MTKQKGSSIALYPHYGIIQLDNDEAFLFFQPEMVSVTMAFQRGSCPRVLSRSKQARGGGIGGESLPMSTDAPCRGLRRREQHSNELLSPSMLSSRGVVHPCRPHAFHPFSFGVQCHRYNQRFSHQVCFRPIHYWIIQGCSHSQSRHSIIQSSTNPSQTPSTVDLSILIRTNRPQFHPTHHQLTT